MSPVDADRLEGMLRLVRLVRGSLADIDEQSFSGDRNLIDATAYRLLHIGEAGNRLSSELRDRHAHIPWRPMIDLRNLLAHAYDHVQPQSVWMVATERLSDVEAMCRAELGE